MAATAEATGRSALLVGLDHRVADRARAALQPLGVDIGEASGGCEALALRRRVNGLVVADPLPDGPVVRFIRAARELTSPLRRSGLVVLAADEHRTAAEALIGRGVNRVVSVGQVESRLPEILDSLMRVAPRARVALPVRFGQVDAPRQRKVFGRTVNLSRSGMLLRMPHRLPIGAELEFSLFLAGLGEPVCGRARIVRHTLDGREVFPGAGLSFTGFAESDRVRLDRGVERLLG